MLVCWRTVEKYGLNILTLLRRYYARIPMPRPAYYCVRTSAIPFPPSPRPVCPRPACTPFCEVCIIVTSVHTACARRVNCHRCRRRHRGGDRWYDNSWRVGPARAEIVQLVETSESPPPSDTGIEGKLFYLFVCSVLFFLFSLFFFWGYWESLLTIVVRCGNTEWQELERAPRKFIINCRNINWRWGVLTW